MNVQAPTILRNCPWPALLLVGLVSLAGCGGSEPKLANPATVQIQLGTQAFTCEVADTASKRERGLMYRSFMPEDRGMIFVFEDEDVRGFWMRNTYIPLDIVYLDKGGSVVAIRSMKPMDEESVSSGKPAKYAIEINAGQATKSGVQEGDRISLPNFR